MTLTQTTRPGMGRSRWKVVRYGTKVEVSRVEKTNTLGPEEQEEQPKLVTLYFSDLHFLSISITKGSGGECRGTNGQTT